MITSRIRRRRQGRVAAATPRSSQFPAPGTIIHSDCVEAMKQLPPASVDLIVTDPPYGVSYKDRTGRSIAGDDRLDWLAPASAGMHRILKPNSLCISFYGWNTIDKFMQAWRAAGFHPVSHLVWQKRYPSKTGFVKASHEQAYLLAKGNPRQPESPLWDVQPWQYSGNTLHPTQKSVDVIKPLLESFSKEGDVVLDPFCGSGTTVVAAELSRRHGIGIELDPTYHDVAQTRIQRRRGGAQ